jgi:BASS family bile acid:Na+ symporter
MPAVQELIHFAVSAGLTLLVFAIGLQASPQDATYVLRRPALLLRSLLAVVVIVPVFAAFMVTHVALTHEVAGAIMLMSISPFPPFVPGKQLKLGGSKSYAFGLLLAISLCSIVTVPVSLAILSKLFSMKLAMDPAQLAKMIFSSILLPMGAGMLVNRFWPGACASAAPWVTRLADLFLVLGVVPVLVSIWPAIVHLVGNASVLAIEAVVIVGLAAGHWLGGPEPRDSAALAAAAATRHPGIALMVAGALAAPSSTRAAILLFVLVGLLTALPYQIWFKHRYPAPRAAAAQHGENA